MKMSKNEKVELNITDLFYTFSDLNDLIDQLTGKLEEATDIIEKVNSTIENAAAIAPSMEKFFIPWEDIKTIINFIDTYGKNSRYDEKIYTCEKIARKMHYIAQNKVLSE